MKEKYSYYYKRLKAFPDSSENAEKEGSRKTKAKVCFTDFLELTVCYNVRYKSSAVFNKPFPMWFEPDYESNPSYIVFIIKISFYSYANKTYFHMKSFAVCLTFVMGFKATRKWSFNLNIFLNQLFDEKSRIASILLIQSKFTLRLLNRYLDNNMWISMKECK